MTAGQRIEKLVTWTGLSTHAFAVSIGLKRSENLYQIKKGNNGISQNLAQMITEKYPQISKSWLLTGEGEMIVDKALAARAIPYYTKDLVSLVENRFEASPEASLELPLYKNADFAAPYMSDSMDPEIPIGAIAICKKCSVEQLVPGASYLVATQKLTAVRYLRIDEGENLKLVPANDKKYDQIIIKISEIEEIFLVLGIIINKSL